MKVRILALALVVAAAAACRSQPEASGSESFEAQTASGSVSFEIRPRIAGENRLILDLRATTHGGSLSEVDLGKAVTLHAGDDTYSPVQAPTLRGHHDGGALVFEPKRKLEHFTVTIRRVRDVPEITLEW